MRALLDDLLDFNRTTFGLDIPIHPSNVGLATLFCTEVDQLSVANPGRNIDLAVLGNARGKWDGARLQQVLANLVSDGLKYGTPDSVVGVTVAADEAQVRFEVTNSGPAMEQSTLDLIFEPLKRGLNNETRDHEGSLGLGLYISREIIKSHGGDISVKSDQKETVFSARLPRSR